MRIRVWLVVVPLLLLASVVVVNVMFERCDWNRPPGAFSTRVECEGALRVLRDLPPGAPPGAVSAFHGVSCNCRSTDALLVSLAVAATFAATIVAPPLVRSALTRRRAWAKIFLIGMLLLGMLLLGVLVLFVVFMVVLAELTVM